MSARKALCVVAMLALLAPVAAAQTGGPQTGGVRGQDLKVGVVDLAAVFKNYKKSAELETRINAEKDRLRESLDAQRERIKEINKQMDLKDIESEAYAMLEEEKRIELARFELMKERLQRTIKQRWEQYNLDLLQDIQDVVRDYGHEHGFTLIFKVEGQPIEEHKLDMLVQIGLKNVLYFSPQVDITVDVVTILNARYQVGEK